MDITFCELRAKDVINMNDGKNYGHIIDISINGTGQILGLILPSEKGMFRAVVNGNSLFIPWRSICRIGDDAILVNIGMERLS